MNKIAVRAFTQRINEPKNKFKPKKEHPLRHNRELVFDTETTIDQYQNFKIGYFRIYQNHIIQHHGLFHDPSMLNETEINNLRNYAKKNKLELYSLNEFIDDIFYPEIFKLGTLCIGFNLAFDISRMAQRSGDSRVNNKGGFTFTLSENRFNPPIIIRKLGDSYTFKFTTTKENKGDDYFSGYFIDSQRLAEVLLDSKHISLKKTGEKLNTKIRKIEDIDHGRVTSRYIEYLITDVRTTHEVYEKLISELDVYQIDIPPTKIYSSASIGKYALKQLGIKPFMELNPDFPNEMKGHILSSYFGGRTECMIRIQPNKVTVLDFTSMYPTITMEMDLWKFIIADKIEIQDVTEEIKELFSKIDLSYLQNKDNWKDFVVMVKIVPEGDILPVRKDYKGIIHHSM